MHHVPGQVYSRRHLHRVSTAGPRARAPVRMHYDDVWYTCGILFSKHNDRHVYKGLELDDCWL